jgi:hypothetical protein
MLNKHFFWSKHIVGGFIIMRTILSTLSIYLSLCVSVGNAAAAGSQSNHQSDQKMRGRVWDIERLEREGLERERLKRERV